MHYLVSDFNSKDSLCTSNVLGVIRVRDVLTSQSPRFYKFRVQYKDCGILRPEIVATTVNVQVIQKECEQRWKGESGFAMRHVSPPNGTLCDFVAAYAVAAVDRFNTNINNLESSLILR